MKKVEHTLVTKFEENIFSTSDISEMKGKFLAERLLRKWNEDFMDEDSGEVITIERSELVYDRGTLLTSDVLSQINFFLESADIKEVKVSDQNRPGHRVDGLSSVWSVAIKVLSKKSTYLLYANSIEMAYKIILDFLEQEIEGGFVFHSIKELDHSTLIPTEEDDDPDAYFYNVNLLVEYEFQEAFEEKYILKADDAESAKEIIKNFIALKNEEENRTDPFEVTIVSAKKIPCHGIVDYHFSQQYFENHK